MNKHAHPVRWERLGSRTVIKTPVIDLQHVTYRHPVRGREREFVCMHAPDWCNVVAVTRDGRLVLVRQFRFGTNDFSLECPGGVMEAGEDPVAAGLRELQEETGFGGGRATLMGSVNPNPAILDNRCHFVLVEDVAEAHALDWDPDEELQTTTVPVEEALAMARSGAVTHSLTLCALFLFEARWRARAV